MTKLCKDCEHFHIRQQPIRGFDLGMAECKKYDLVVDFADRRKFKWLSCVKKERVKERVMTNADCIRKMSDEQLDEFLAQWECGDIDYSVTFCDLCKEGGNELGLDCDGCRKHWLKRDAVDYGGLLYWKRNTIFERTEKPCETCKHDAEPWYSDACDGCCKAHSNYEPKGESNETENR